MTVILIGGTKGGTGKTTIATNMAVECINRGEDTIFMDCDRQQSASNWVSVRDSHRKETKNLKGLPCIQKYGNNVNEAILSLKKKYKNVIIDAGGFDSAELRSALTTVDKFYTPFSPTQTDIWGLANLDQVIAWAKPYNKKLEPKVFINLADPNPNVKTLEKTKKILKDAKTQCIKLCDVVIYRRISFVHAIPQGRGVSELDSTDMKAVNEVRSLYNEIFGEN
jgi:chromosome partitioning protein